MQRMHAIDHRLRADLPQCQAVTVAGLSSFGICIPALAVVGALDVTEAESLFQIENCAGIASDECDQVRRRYACMCACMRIRVTFNRETSRYACSQL